MQLRLEDGPLVIGAGSYVADLVDSDTLHCAFVRSPVAHGSIDSIDLEFARSMPGVVAILTGSDLDLPDLPPSPGRGAPPAEGMGQPVLARDRVRFVGEAVAVVVAESAVQAVDAAEQVWVEIDPLPVVKNVGDALRNDSILFPDAATNLVETQTVSSGGMPPVVAHTVEVEVDIPRVSPVTIEPLAILVRPTPDGRLEVWCGHQSPGRLPGQISSLLGIDSSSIRARVPDVGGAFGTKGQFYAEYVVVSAAALRLGRPVVWVQSRREQLVMGTHGRGQVIKVRIGGDPDGRIRSIRAEIVGDIGAYPATGSRIPFFTQNVSQGLYDVEFFEATATVAVTNKAPTGPYRGAGRPEGAIAIERAVDAFAAELGLLPEDVRWKNYIPESALPYTTHTGAIYDSGDYAAALTLAVETAGVTRWRSEQKRRIDEGGDPIGIGLGTFIERAGGGPTLGEYGKVELLPDGRIDVRTGSTSAGQAHRTVWSRLVADLFSVSIDLVNFHAGDTDEVSQSVGSFASRSAQTGAAAVHRTGVRVLERARERAAEMLEASPADLRLTDGRFEVAGAPGSGITLGEIAAAASAAGEPLAEEEMFVPGAQTFPYGAYVAVVEVSLETGAVSLLELVAVDDCGNVLNPMVVEGQLHGSVLQGVGTAMLESIVYDEDGQPLTSNLMTYLIPTSTQHVPLTSKRLVHPAPSNPLGVKGAGEAGCIGVPPSILNAVHDALRPLGVSTVDFPLTPARVWDAIQRAQRETRQ